MGHLLTDSKRSRDVLRCAKVVLGLGRSRPRDVRGLGRSRPRDMLCCAKVVLGLGKSRTRPRDLLRDIARGLGRRKE